MLKPIDTRYGGYRFRSRLEARWAVFFDALEIPWQYEREGFNIDGVWYLPDFYFPELSMYAEVKPEKFTQQEFELIAALGGIVFDGLPEDKSYPIASKLCTNCDDLEGGHGYCWQCYRNGNTDMWSIDLVWSHSKGRCWYAFGYDAAKGDPEYQYAAEKAKSARFENRQKRL